jgi:hypothetical protein
MDKLVVLQEISAMTQEYHLVRIHDSGVLHLDKRHKFSSAGDVLISTTSWMTL